MKPLALACLLLALLLTSLCVAQAPSRPATPAAATPAAPAPPPPVIEATVNGSPISQAHVDQAIANHWAVPIMRSIIEDRLVRQEARRLGIKVSPEAVQALAAAERATFPSEAAYQRHLHALGYTTESYTEKLTTDVLVQNLMDQLTAVSSDEIKQYYADHVNEFAAPAQFHVYLIETGTIEEAYLVRERLASGDKFDVVARELSQHPSKAKGGDLGFVTAAQLPQKALADAITAMEPGVVSSPLSAGGKYTVAMVKERKAAQITPVEQAREQIAERLKTQKNVSRRDLIDMLARRADINVTWAPARTLNQEYLALRHIGVVVDGKPLELPQPPVRLPNGNIIVPAKPVLEALGATLTWQAKDQSLFATNTIGKVKLTVGSSKAVVGTGRLEAREMKQAPVMREGSLYIAPRVALEALGAVVVWDGIRNRLVVTGGSEAMPSPTVAPAGTAGLERQ